MKLEPCIILKLFLNFSDSGPEYSYKLYSYKNLCSTLISTAHSALALSLESGNDQWDFIKILT